MWTHTPAVLGFALALWALTAGRSGLAGAAVAAACFARPATAPAAGISRAVSDSSFPARMDIEHGCYKPSRRLGVIRCRRQRWPGWPASFTTTGCSETCSVALRSAPRSGFGSSGPETCLPVRCRMGLAGLTVSPSRGLLIYSPIVLVATLRCDAGVEISGNGPTEPAFGRA